MVVKAEYIPNFDKGLVEGASDEDIKALTIANFQMLQEILSFVRDLKEAFDKMQQQGGLMGSMMGGLVPPTLSPDKIAEIKRNMRK